MNNDINLGKTDVFGKKREKGAETEIRDHQEETGKLGQRHIMKQ